MQNRSSSPPATAAPSLGSSSGRWRRSSSRWSPAIIALAVLAAADAVATDEAANQLPAPAFVYTLAGLTVQVDASGSGDLDGEIAAYRWDFGDGTRGDGISASHTYARPGTYTVSLTVVDDRGAAAGVDYVIAPRALNQGPTARFDHRVSGLEIAVDASNSTDPEGQVVEFDWDFGDGNTAQGVRASHTYETGGSYTVGLTVADDPGATDTITKVVPIPHPAPAGPR